MPDSTSSSSRYPPGVESPRTQRPEGDRGRAMASESLASDPHRGPSTSLHARSGGRGQNVPLHRGAGPSPKLPGGAFDSPASSREPSSQRGGGSQLGSRRGQSATDREPHKDGHIELPRDDPRARMKKLETLLKNILHQQTRDQEFNKWTKHYNTPLQFAIDQQNLLIWDAEGRRGATPVSPSREEDAYRVAQNSVNATEEGIKRALKSGWSFKKVASSSKGGSPQQLPARSEPRSRSRRMPPRTAVPGDPSRPAFTTGPAAGPASSRDLPQEARPLSQPGASTTKSEEAVKRRLLKDAERQAREDEAGKAARILNIVQGHDDLPAPITTGAAHVPWNPATQSSDPGSLMKRHAAATARAYEARLRGQDSGRSEGNGGGGSTSLEAGVGRKRGRGEAGV